jgi:putative membrane protein
MKQLLAAASVCALMIAAPAWAQTSGTQTTTGNETTTTTQGATGARSTTGAQPLSQQDKTFVQEAGAGNLAEADLGSLAMRKGAVLGFREFGRWMYTDHGLVGQNWLRAIVAAQGETLQPTLTAEQQQMRRKLEGVSGRQFDQEYIQAMITDHEKDIPKFQTEARDGQNPMIKNFAQNMVPVLQQHLEGARALAGKGGVAGGEGASERSGSSTQR